MKNFAIQTNKENVNILKNSFYHRVPQASEYRKTFFGMDSDSGLVTALNCPECGCDVNPIRLGKQNEGRSFTQADVSPQSLE